jgi:tRNA U55 pseudouridine synthase TruB
VGPFSEAVRLDALTPEVPLIPLAEALAHLPAVSVTAEEAQRLGHGQFVPAADSVPDGPVRVLAPTGELAAIATARGHGEARLLTPDKVFQPSA